ncbi:MAG: hypothetical protein KAH01_07635, partial [Caldisericia bacterium]|nr:hypothetical protein [Caldisericia bacterium]
MINMNALINKYAEADTGGVTAFIVYKYKEMRQQIEEIMEDDDLWEMQRKIRDIVEDLNATPNPHVGVITYNV